jgi:hypothetical protein
VARSPALRQAGRQAGRRAGRHPCAMAPIIKKGITTMSTHRRLVIGVATGLAIAIAAGSAHANRLRISHGSLWRAVFSPLRFVSSGITAASCNVTLESSFHSGTITKRPNVLLGHVSRASVGTCTSGSATVLVETTPWHIAYSGFEGRLPEATGIDLLLIGFSFQIRDTIFGSLCLGRTTQMVPAGGILRLGAMEVGGNILVTEFVFDSTRQIPCGALSGQFEGVATVVESGSPEKMLIRLI